MLAGLQPFIDRTLGMRSLRAALPRCSPSTLAIVSANSWRYTARPIPE
jgi:hypothetical protein